jgi:hypothetical protein
MRTFSNKFYSEKRGEVNEEHNDPACKRRGDYDFLEVAKLLPGNQVSLHPVRVRFKTFCYATGLVVMSPHSNYFNNFLLFIYLIH